MSLDIANKFQDDVYYDIATFIHDYDGLISGTPTANPIVARSAHVYSAVFGGIELSCTLQMTSDWRLFGTYTFTESDFQQELPSVLPRQLVDGNNPRHMATLHSLWNVGNNVHFDVLGRFVDELPGPNVEGYVAIDASLIVHMTQDIDLSIVATNLLDASRFEFGPDFLSGLQATEIERGIYGMISWRR